MGKGMMASERGESRTDLQRIWAAALGELQLGVTKANFETWFKDTSILSEEDDVYCVAVPNAFAREWLENKYRPQVRQAVQHIVGRTVDVRFVTAPAGASAPPGGRPGPRPGIPPAQASSAPTAAERREMPVSAVLNPRYAFSTFVVGSNNRLAHAAALSVAERPGHS